MRFAPLLLSTLLLLPVGEAHARALDAVSRVIAKRVNPFVGSVSREAVPSAAGRSAAERAALARVLADLDRSTLRHIETRFGPWIEPGRLAAARAAPARFMTPEEYALHLQRVFPGVPPARLKGILGDYSGGTVNLSRASQTAPLTLAHERLHGLADPRFGRGAGRRIDEGVTEYFARRVSPDPALRDLPPVYPDEQVIVHMLAARAGDDVLARAYFRGEVGALRTVVDRDLGPGTFAAAVQAMESGRPALARTILRGATP